MNEDSDHRLGHPALDGTSRGRWSDLRRRIYLTYRYHGLRSVDHRFVQPSRR